MNNFMIPTASADIYAAEFAFGIYSEKAARVRAYWLHAVEPDKFEETAYPEDVWESKEHHQNYLALGKQHAEAMSTRVGI